MKMNGFIRILALILASASLHGEAMVIDPAASGIAVDVKASPPHSFTCDLTDYSADIRLDPQSGNVKSASVSFFLTDLETHNDKRDAKMQRWMDVDHYNAIRWVMESVEEVDGTLVGHGLMTMHGINLPVDVPFSITVDGDQVAVAGEADFDYMDFGLPRIRLFLFTVNPGLHVHFSLKGTLSNG